MTDEAVSCVSVKGRGRSRSLLRAERVDVNFSNELRHGSRKAQTRKEAGAVLVYTLWILAGLSFLALQATAVSRYRAFEVRWVWDELQKRETIHSLVRLALHSQEIQGMLPLNRWVTCSIGGISFQVRREDEKSKVPLNQSDPNRLRGAVEKVLGPGAEPVEVDRLVDAILDWQDQDQLKRMHGAESDDYLRLGLPPPADGPFTSVCELRLVLGVTPELLWGRPWDEAVREALAAREGVTSLEEAPRSLAESLSAVGSSGTRLTFLFPRSTEGYEVEMVVFSESQGQWSLLDRCRGYVHGF